MQLYLRIHDIKNNYKGSCQLPINSINVDEDGNVNARFAKINKEFIKDCVSKLEGVSLEDTDCNAMYFLADTISFNLKDYHYTCYIE